MKKLLYVHGLGSGENSQTAQILRNNLKDYQVFAPEIPQDPENAYEFLVNFYRDNVPDIIVGSSLGGFYASLIGGCYKLLINPALVPHEDIRKNFGVNHTYLYLTVRSDGCPIYRITEEFYQRLKKLYDHFYEECIDEEFRYETYALIGLNDKVINPEDTKRFFLDHYSKNDHLIEVPDMGHRPDEDDICQTIIPEIIKLIGD